MLTSLVNSLCWASAAEPQACIFSKWIAMLSYAQLLFFHIQFKKS